MGAKTGELATQLEAKARDAVATLEKLGDADWKKVTAAEKWTVGATAHHLAGGLEAVSGIVTGIVAGAAPRGGFTTAIMRRNMPTARKPRRSRCSRRVRRRRPRCSAA
jgi:hypothetical protein